MARRKRSSTILEKAERRAASLEAIDVNLDLGNGMSIKEFRASIQDVRDTVSHYNRTLSSVDDIHNDLTAKEEALSDLTARMLAAVAVVYGRASSEYEMAGGKRRGERRKSKGAIAAPASTSAE